MNTARFAVVLAFTFLFHFSQSSLADEKKPLLNAEDRAFLDGLFKDFLFDPKGAEYVVVPVEEWTFRGEKETRERAGWYVAGKEGKVGRVYFTDGESILAPEEAKRKKIDFVKECRAFYNPKQEPELAVKSEPAYPLGDPLIVAASLYRLEEMELVAWALAKIPLDREAYLSKMRELFANRAFQMMAYSFSAFDDQQALNHADRLQRVYSLELGDERAVVVASILDSLKKRQKDGTFGKKPDKDPPKDFDKWETSKKVAYLIESLQYLNERCNGKSYSYYTFHEAWCFKKLKDCGEEAIQALIDALEKENRYSRSIWTYLGFAEFGATEVIPVSAILIELITEILPQPVFDPAPKKAESDQHKKRSPQETAAYYRRFWKEYGHLTTPERYMKMLTGETVPLQIRREVSGRLARLVSNRSGPNPIQEKFTKPTIAEAILALRDDEQQRYDEELKKEEGEKRTPDQIAVIKSRIDSRFFDDLFVLGDKRIVAELGKRFSESKDTLERVNLADCCFELGELKYIRIMVKEFNEGKIEVGSKGAKLRVFERILLALIWSKDPEMEKVFNALLQPTHTHHKLLRELVLAIPDDYEQNRYQEYTYFIPILRRALDDKTPMGVTYSIKGKRIYISGKGRREINHEIPSFLITSGKIKAETELRVCDCAAEKLSDILYGIPEYHPLADDGEGQLKQLRAAYDECKFTFRPMDRVERDFFKVESIRSAFLPKIKQLEQPATPDDVKSGKAIFHLEGKGKPADLKLPACATLKGDEKKVKPEPVLIVQAERNDKGEIVYGGITRRGVRTFTEKEVTEIKPLPKE